MATPLPQILSNLHAAAEAAGLPDPRLLAVSKTQPAEAVAALAAQGQQAFGENYVQEALAKMQALQHLALEWHLIGHLQSNKAEAVATRFDWVQSVDRPKLVTALARHRPAASGPLNVLIQVNISGEASKSGVAPGEERALAAVIRTSRSSLRVAQRRWLRSGAKRATGMRTATQAWQCAQCGR